MKTLVPINWEAPGAGDDIVRDLRYTGFCVIRNHPVDLTMLSSLRQFWRIWFTDCQVKESYRHDITQAGWFGLSQAETAVGSDRRDHKEYFQVFGETIGQVPSNMRTMVREHFKAMNAFAVELAARIDAWNRGAAPLDLHKIITDSTNTMLRVAYYPSTSDAEGEVEWAAPHSDVNLFTLIPCNAEPGLQVYCEEDGWEYVPWHSTYLVVNAGDMLELMSDGYFKSAQHRVIQPPVDTGDRLSLPFFVHPRPEVVLKDGLTAQEFLERRLRELGVMK